MIRAQLEHILRASAAITGADAFVVIGSQAIHGATDRPPEALLRSIEADLFSLRSPKDAELIDGSIGEMSPFHRAFGYYAHGVGEDTAIVPEGWKQRLIPLASPATGGATGLCLDPADLAVSKLIAGRPKDLEYLRVMAAHGLLDATLVAMRLADTSIPEAVRALSETRLANLRGP